ncbi:MAG: glycosyltransferase family 4 protein [Sumerlaeia bacterium]
MSATKLSIGFLLPKDIHDPKTGNDWYNNHVVTGLRAHGHTVEILSTEAFNGMNPNIAALQIQLILSTHSRRLSILLVDTWLYRFLHRSKKIFRQIGCPVVSFHHECYWETLQSFHLRTIHYWKMRRFVSRCDGHIGVNKTVLQQDGCKKNFKLIYPGCSFTVPNDQLLQKKVGELHLITVGNYTSRKGHHHLINAIGEMKREDPDSVNGLTLEVVGNRSFDSNYTTYLEHLVRELRIQDNVILSGWMNREELHQAFQCKHAFASASEGESFGRVVLEALLHGLPAALSPLRVFKEIMANSNCGDCNGNYALLFRLWLKMNSKSFLNLQYNAKRRAHEISKTWPDVVEDFEAALKKWVSI